MQGPGNPLYKSLSSLIMELLWAGALFSAVGKCLIALWLFIQRYAHKINLTNSMYFAMWQWWVGFVLMSVGEVGNFLAYGLAPITMVAPLGGIPVVFNFILSRVVLLENRYEMSHEKQNFFHFSANSNFVPTLVSLFLCCDPFT
jgi:hypothetical protein